MVATLAAEDEESSVERERCCEKLKVLENGLRELKSVQEHPSFLHYKGKQKGISIHERFTHQHQPGSGIFSRDAAPKGGTSADDSSCSGEFCGSYLSSF